MEEETESYVGGNPFPTNNIPLTGSAQISTSGLTSGNGISNTTTTNNSNFWLGSSITANVNPFYPKELKDVIITPETIEIIYVQRAMYSYTQTNFTMAGVYQVHNPDITFKEIYGCKDGALTLIKTVYGKVIPPRQVEESFEFDE